MLLSLLFFGLVPGFASPSVLANEKLVFRLQNIVNEFDLLIKNHDADLSDLRRQSREMKVLKVYERIPTTADLAGLRRQLDSAAREAGVAMVSLKEVGRSPKPRAIPKEVRSDAPRFQFSEDQLLETLFLSLSVKGNKDSVERWIRDLPDKQLRLVISDGELSKERSGDTWQLRARAFRFREVRFPKIVPVDPRQVAEKGSLRDPIVKDLVGRAMLLRKRAEPLYGAKGELLLNAARMRVYVAKTEN